MIQRSEVLGLFSTARYPEADPRSEHALRTRLRAVLLGEREPAQRDALLLGAAATAGARRLSGGQGEHRAATKRAKEIADGGIAGTAVSDAVRYIQAAVMVAVIVPAATNGGGG